jgi:cAMP-dependent protein kinase regulator
MREIAKKKGNKQRMAVSAEAYGAHNKKGDFVAQVVEKSADTTEKLQKRLMQAFMFNNLDAGEFKVVVGAIEEAKFNAGEDVITEGDQGDCMYVLEEGTLECTKVINGNKTHLKNYEPGEGFGELALLYNAPRAATITATTPCLCWRLDRGTFNHIVKDAAQRKREKYEDFIEKVEILASLSPYERTNLVDAMNSQTFNEGENIISEGEMGDRFYVINEG